MVLFCHLCGDIVDAPDRNPNSDPYKNPAVTNANTYQCFSRECQTLTLQEASARDRPKVQDQIQRAERTRIERLARIHPLMQNYDPLSLDEYEDSIRRRLINARMRKHEALQRSGIEYMEMKRALGIPLDDDMSGWSEQQIQDVINILDDLDIEQQQPGNVGHGRHPDSSQPRRYRPQQIRERDDSHRDRGRRAQTGPQHHRSRRNHDRQPAQVYPNRRAQRSRDRSRGRSRERHANRDRNESRERPRPRPRPIPRSRPRSRRADRTTNDHNSFVEVHHAQTPQPEVDNEGHSTPPPPYDATTHSQPPAGNEGRGRVLGRGRGDERWDQNRGQGPNTIRGCQRACCR